MQPPAELPVKGAYRFADAFDPEADFSFFNGDCLELLAQLPDAAARLVMTSPPCNIGRHLPRAHPLLTRIRHSEIPLGYIDPRLTGRF